MRRCMRRKGARYPAGKSPKAPEPIGYCSYCGTALYQPWQFHWMYDEDGQRVRKCKWMRRCCERRRQSHTGVPCFGTGRMGKKDGSRVSQRSERMKTSKEGKGGI